jgi:hypothetical protein
MIGRARESESKPKTSVGIGCFLTQKVFRMKKIIELMRMEQANDRLTG